MEFEHQVIVKLLTYKYRLDEKINHMKKKWKCVDRQHRGVVDGEIDR